MATRADSSLEAVWARLQPLMISKRDEFFAVMARHELTPPHGQALTMLAGGPMKMRDMADHLVCDASYVTAVVDNLEAKGLATRQPSTTDRRVKEIALTPAGQAAADEIKRTMSAPPAVLGSLSSADRAVLARILGKLDLDTEQTFWMMKTRPHH